MASRDVIDVTGAFRRQERTLKSGEVRQKNYRVDFTVVDPLLVNVDPEALGGEIADAWKAVIQDGFRHTEQAAPQTIAKRRWAARTRGKRERWGTKARPPRVPYHKRYAGGRIGHMPPAQSVRKYIDSGRLINSIVLRSRRRSTGDAVLTMNVAANRLDPHTWGGDFGSFQAMLDKMQRDIPALTSSSAVLQKILIARRSSVLAQAVVNSEQKLRALQAKIARLKRQRLAALRTLARILI